MNTVKINNPVQREFAMVPNAVWLIDASVEAKAVMAYLLSQRDGSAIRVAQIEADLGLGRDRRRKAMQQLVKLGLIRMVTHKDRANRIVTNTLEVDTSALLVGLGAPARGSSKPRKGRPPEFPAVGNSRRSGNPSQQGLKSTPSATGFQATSPRQDNKNAALSEIFDLVKASKLATSQARAGNDIVLSGGYQIKAGSKQHAEIQDMLRNEAEA